MKIVTNLFLALVAGSALSLSLVAGPESLSRDYTNSKDLKEVATPAPPVCTWSGFYIGANAGGQFGHSEDKTGSFGYNADNQPWGYSESGFAGAGDLGFNWQWNWLVLGPEFDLGYTDLNGRGTQRGSPGGDTRGESSSDFYTTLRGRLGVAVGCWMVYGTGGAIGVNYDTRVVDDCDIAPCGGTLVNAHSQDFDWGYTVGGGVERMFGRRWSIKLDYLYFALDSQSFSGVTNLGIRYNWTGETAGHIVRAGLNFHF